MSAPNNDDEGSFSIPPHLTPLDLVRIGFACLSEAARRAAILGVVSGTGADETYSTRRGHGPPGVPHRRWCKLAPRVPGATRIGRWWTVPKIAWAAFAHAETQKRRSSRH